MNHFSISATEYLPSPGIANFLCYQCVSASWWCDINSDFEWQCRARRRVYLSKGSFSLTQALITGLNDEDDAYLAALLPVIEYEVHDIKSCTSLFNKIDNMDHLNHDRQPSSQAFSEFVREMAACDFEIMRCDDLVNQTGFTMSHYHE